MIIKIITAYYNSLWEELKTGNFWKPKFILIGRVLTFIICSLMCGFLVFIALLTKNKVEIVSLYIAMLYMIYLTGTLLVPWKILSIDRTASMVFSVLNLGSPIIFILFQAFNLYYHEGQMEWYELSGIYSIFLIQVVIMLVILILFFMSFKSNHSIQKHKKLKDEWKRLSHYTIY